MKIEKHANVGAMDFCVLRTALLVSAMGLAQIAAAQNEPAALNVGSSGAATYAVPIDTPDNGAGLGPNLSLVYGSQNGNGWVGLGWRLQGLSAISRCPQTAAQDGTAWVGGIRYAATDRFCLDGQRLVAKAGPGGSVGAYGADQTYYGTEREAFSNIKSIGAQPGGAGPVSFRVQTRAGLILEYGATTDSRILAWGKSAVRTWALNKVSDTSGNFVSIAYSTEYGQFYPQAVSRSMAGVLKNVVQFSYEEGRPDPQLQYQGGSFIKTMKRLSEVKVLTDGGVSYKVSYDTALSDVSVATTVTRCASSSASVCLPPIVLGRATTESAPWAISNPTLMYDATLNASLSWINHPKAKVITGDFNGDGRMDFFLQCPGCGWETTETFLSNGDGSWTITNPSHYYLTLNASKDWINHPQAKVITGDFNGDGKTDFFLQCPGCGWETTETFLSKGDGTWEITNPTLMFETLNASKDWINHPQAKVITGDFNGDGKTDFFLQCPGCNWGTTETFLAKGDGTWEISNPTLMFETLNASRDWINHPKANVITGDFNGDGRTDFFLQCPGCDWGTTQMFLAKSGGWEITNPPLTVDGYNVSRHWINHAQANIIKGDFNGDGKTDFILQCPGCNWATTETFFSQGDGTWDILNPALTHENTNASLDWINNLNTRVITGDFNGDGKTDFFLQCLGCNWGSTPTFLSNGNSTWRITNLPLTIDALNASFSWLNEPKTVLITGDISGDGKTDFFIQCPGCNWGTTSTFIAARDSGRVVKSIESGVKYELTQSSLSQAWGTNYTVTAGSGSTSHGLASTQVITGVKTFLPGGLSTTTSHKYGDMLVDLGGGRGNLGFAWVQSRNDSTGLVSRTFYRQAWPYTGQVWKVGSGTSEASWSDLGLTTTQHGCIDVVTLADCTVQPGKRYGVYPKIVESLSNKDLTAAGGVGAGLPGSRATQVVDGWGNVKSVTVETLKPDGTPSDFKKVTTNDYAPVDETAWRLGKVLRSTVTSTGTAP